MITLVADHWLNPGSIDTAMKAFNDNTKKLSQGKGFHSRLVLRSTTDPTKITTVTTWKDEEEYKKFMSDLDKRQAQRDPKAPKTMLGEKLESFQVLSSA